MTEYKYTRLKNGEPAVFLTPAEVAKQLKVSVRTIYKWIDTCELPSFTIPPGGRLLRIHPDELQEFIDNHRYVPKTAVQVG